MASFYCRPLYQKKHTADNQLKEASSQSVNDAILIRNKKISLILNQE
jgi:hypothetical protein